MLHISRENNIRMDLMGRIPSIELDNVASPIEFEILHVHPIFYNFYISICHELNMALGS